MFGRLSKDNAVGHFLERRSAVERIGNEILFFGKDVAGAHNLLQAGDQFFLGTVTKYGCYSILNFRFHERDRLNRLYIAPGVSVRLFSVPRPLTPVALILEIGEIDKCRRRRF